MVYNCEQRTLNLRASEKKREYSGVGSLMDQPDSFSGRGGFCRRPEIKPELQTSLAQFTVRGGHPVLTLRLRGEKILPQARKTNGICIR